MEEKTGPGRSPGDKGLEGSQGPLLELATLTDTSTGKALHASTGTGTGGPQTSARAGKSASAVSRVVRMQRRQHGHGQLSDRSSNCRALAAWLRISWDVRRRFLALKVACGHGRNHPAICLCKDEYVRVHAIQHLSRPGLA
ncbi:hypothetical protein J3F84DRAFT_215699 [Trichoderma pleuroticola]